jgi:hypothetical protein
MNLIHTGDTFCCLCGNEETSIKSDGIPRWSRYKIDKDGDYNSKGIWDKESYICTNCYNKVKSIKDDRRCSRCGEKSTASYYKAYDKDNNWDKKSWLCNKCNADMYNNNVVKPMRPCRNKGISKESTTGKGIIGEAIVSKVLGIEMCSKKVNNFNYKFDLFQSDKYGNIQVKIAGPYFNQWKYDLRHGSPCNCDTVILLCMDEKWENVARVYIIPSENIETLELSIYLGTQRVSKWDEFQVDKKPYNYAYHNLRIENCTMLKNE